MVSSWHGKNKGGRGGMTVALVAVVIGAGLARDGHIAMAVLAFAAVPLGLWWRLPRIW